MNKNNELITYIFMFALSIFFVTQSKFDFNLLLSPISTIFSLFSSAGLGINWLFILIALVSLCASISLFIIYVFDNPSDNFILIGPAIVSVIIVVINSFSLYSIMFSIGIFTAFFYIQTTTGHEIEKMKLPKIFDISFRQSSVSLTIINLSIALVVMTVLLNNPSYADKEISSMTSSMLGMNISDMDSLETEILELQRQAAYKQAELIETAVLYGIYTQTSGLTIDEKHKCFEVINASIDDIDAQAKASIDLQLTQMSSDQKYGSIESTLHLLDIFKKYYPYITLLTVFMLLEMFKIIMKYLIAFISKSIWVKPTVVSSSLI